MGERLPPYEPCYCGIHVCGVSYEQNAFYTVLNLPCRTEEEARALFERALSECACMPGEPEDYIVDLNMGPYVNHCDDFPMSRQMLSRLEALYA